MVDAFVHTTEQYLTYPADAPLQDRQAEAILLTLIEEGPKALADPQNYAVRANLMWCATQALNGLIGCGVPQDWATHMIGHELTALYGIDHAQSLALVLPGVLQHQRHASGPSCCNMPTRVGHLRVRNGEDEDARIDQAIDKTEQFFRSLGVGTRLADYQIPREAVEVVAARLAKRGMKLGEHQDLGEKEVQEDTRNANRVRGELKYSVHAAIIRRSCGSHSERSGESPADFQVEILRCAQDDG